MGDQYLFLRDLGGQISRFEFCIAISKQNIKKSSNYQVLHRLSLACCQSLLKKINIFSLWLNFLHTQNTTGFHFSLLVKNKIALKRVLQFHFI